MMKRKSIDLVGRAAERLDLNAPSETADYAAPPPALNTVSYTPEPSPRFTPPPPPPPADFAIETPPAPSLDLPAAAAEREFAPMPAAPAATAGTIGLEWERLHQEGYLTPQNQRSLTAEEFRIIKRPLLRSAFNRDGTQTRLGNVAMVTSACPGDGKTFTTINLGLSIASERDLHVLLIDSDIRRMGLSRALGLADRPGLMDLLTQPGATFSDVVVHTSIPNLSIIPAGKPIEGSTEIFASQAMVKFARDVASRYRDRFIIFDTPPILASSEPGVLAAHVGQVVMVVKANETRKRSVAEAVSVLDTQTHINFVLNKVSQSAAPDRFGYYEYYNADTDA